MKLIKEEKNLNNKLIEIEFFIVVNTKNNWLLGKNGWIDLNLPWDKRYKINVFSSEQQARRYADENCVVYPIKVPLDLSDVAVLESLHPEINLGWTRTGGRHPVDADTFTAAKAGDILSIHISDDLPDLEYQIKDGSYLDDEAVKDDSYYRDRAVEIEPIDQSAKQFSDTLDQLIGDKVKEAVQNILKSQYKSDFKFYRGGTTNGVVPMSLSLEASWKRRIPEIYNDKDTVLESAESSQETNKVEPELVANSDDIYNFICQLYDLRKESIANDGEYGLGNLVFKEFRNLGYLDNLKKLRRIEKSKELSLKELAEAFKTNKKMSKDEFDKFKKAHPDYTFEDKSHGTLIFKDGIQIGTFLKDFAELWLAESCCDDHLEEINYKDELYETFGSDLSEKERGLLWPEFKDKYWLSALEKKDKYVTFNSEMSTYYIYEWINFNNKKYLDHIITYIPGYNVMYYKNRDALERLCKAADTYLEEYNKWDASEGKKKRIADYRRLAKIDDNFIITEDNLDEQALNNTCRINYEYPKDVLIKELLN